MFKNNIVTPFDINDVVKRKEITLGNVFSYTSGSATRYGAITVHDGFMYSFKLKRYGEGKEIAVSATCSLQSSSLFEQSCTIKGYYSIRVNFDAIPSIMMCTRKDRPAFASVVSIPTAMDKAGKCHLFLHLGVAPVQRGGKDVVAMLQLTGLSDIKHHAPIISYAPLEGMVAIRGKAELEVVEKKGES